MTRRRRKSKRSRRREEEEKEEAVVLRLLSCWGMFDRKNMPLYMGEYTKFGRCRLNATDIHRGSKQIRVLWASHP